MARTFWSAALLFIAAGLTGCSAGARFVETDASGGIVAVPQSSMFQWYYRNAAIDLIREKHDPDNMNRVEVVIDSEGEVPVGQQTRTDQRTDTRPLDRNGKPIGELTTNTSVTSTSAMTEYRIKYHVTPKFVTGMPTNSSVTPAGAVQSPNGSRANSSGVVPAGGQQSSNPVPPTGQPVLDSRTAQPQPATNNYTNFQPR